MTSQPLPEVFIVDRPKAPLDEAVPHDSQDRGRRQIDEHERAEQNRIVVGLRLSDKTAELVAATRKRVDEVAGGFRFRRRSAENRRAMLDSRASERWIRGPCEQPQSRCAGPVLANARAGQVGRPKGPLKQPRYVVL